MLDTFVQPVGNSATTPNANPISSLGNYTVPTVLVFRGISKYARYLVSAGNYESLRAASKKKIADEPGIIILGATLKRPVANDSIGKESYGSTRSLLGVDQSSQD